MEKNSQTEATRAFSACMHVTFRISDLYSLTNALPSRIQSKIVDGYIKGEPNYLQEDWLSKSNPIRMESVMLAHVIQRKEISFFNLLDNFKIGLPLAAILFFSFLGVLTISFFINEVANRIRSGRRSGIFKGIFRAMSSFGTSRLSAVGIFVLFSHLFVWIIQLFLTNNVKTNKVVSLSW